jgi:5-hydroxyisourate hydrolase-like protein (transthyretin family)
MTNPPLGKWTYLDTTVTDATGRAVYHIPEEKRLMEGMYPVKMVVR